ncbi:NAD-dependent epimerase/dehydratase family protein [Microlunatus elymi]|uniref:NAD-dependent epimerase/dehydratase family protein n=1 Tax=Microlunatus elymi TaxID=2596828 RepID=A0A516PW97_9ACTN|nr:NAD-dependent epimerase/dehydratase family protein [Microlunatus elymi]QDP95453.1 NAD-dependent epimerase/dehydratase family protein [Microlunatus elymi]
MKILVTGASGLLGGATARALAERGDQVTVLQRRPSGLGLREVLGTVTDPDTVRRAVRGQQAVLHLAAKVNVTGAEADYRRVNVDGTRTVVEECRAAGVERLINVSSPSVAHSGSSLVGAGAEPADPVRARGPYARTKAEAELLALAADSPSLAVLAIRPHIVWGPGDTQLVGRIVARARRGRLPLFGPATALVDTTYLTNAVDALTAAVDRCTVDGVHGEALVVSNGEPRPIGEFLSSIARAAGAPLPTRHLPVRPALWAGAAAETLWSLRPGDAADPPLTRFLVEQLSTAHWFDQRRTREALGWRPAVQLDHGFAELARWYAAVHRPRR